MKAYDVPLAVRLLVTAGLAGVTVVAAAKTKTTPNKVGASVVGGAATLAYVAWAFASETPKPGTEKTT